MNRHNRLVDIFKVMAKNLPSRSVTVKVRIGWDEKVPTTHKLIPELQKAANGRLAAIMVNYSFSFDFLFIDCCYCYVIDPWS